MSWLSCQSVAIEIEGRPIVEQVTFSLSAGDRIGVVGPNGLGKTTFLRVLEGSLDPLSGQVQRPPSVRIQRLEQWRGTSKDTIYQVAYDANPELQALQKRLRDLEERMAHPDEPNFDGIVDAWGQTSEAFQTQGGYEWDSKVESSLMALGFTPDRWDDPPTNLSGGEAHRLALLAVILSGAQVWLLDEPTNHLDVVTIGWLENALRTAPSAQIIVSHDRTFLNHVATRTMSWEDGSFWIAPGGFASYQHLRRERLRLQTQAFERQMEEERRLRSYIDRWRSGTRARQAQSRQKTLDRITQDAQVKPPSIARDLHLTHQGSERKSMEPALTIQDLKLTRGDRSWTPLSLKVPMGARVALLGPNGTGKTTLLDRLAVGGKGILWHSSLTVEYLHQTAVQELPDETLGMDYAYNLGFDREEMHYLGSRFGIPNRLWESQLGTWSGGERSRLKLLETLMRPSQVLLLDEPTNHLDIHMREALERLLDEYPGTLVVASHDRSLLESLSSHTLWSTGTDFVFQRQPYRSDMTGP